MSSSLPPGALYSTADLESWPVRAEEIETKETVTADDVDWLKRSFHFCKIVFSDADEMSPHAISLCFNASAAIIHCVKMRYHHDAGIPGDVNWERLRAAVESAETVVRTNQPPVQTAPDADTDQKQDDGDNPDGPIGGGFRWNGQDHHGLTGKAWALVKYLWSRGDRTATFSELAEPVWDDREWLTSSDAVGSLRRNANKWFRRERIPYLISINGQTVYLKPA